MLGSGRRSTRKSAWVEGEPATESTMPTTVDWGAEGVKIVRAASIRGAMRGPPGTGRATAFEFSGTGGRGAPVGPGRAAHLDRRGRPRAGRADGGPSSRPP